MITIARPLQPCKTILSMRYLLPGHCGFVLSLLAMSLRVIRGQHAKVLVRHHSSMIARDHWPYRNDTSRTQCPQNSRREALCRSWDRSDRPLCQMTTLQ
jgi:hypothetical protein